MGLLPDSESRSTVDLVVLGLTLVIGFVIAFTLVGVVVIELVHPEFDSDPMIQVESEILGVLVGALVGFIGGRGVGRSEGGWTGPTSSPSPSLSPGSSSSSDASNPTVPDERSISR